MNKTYKVVLFDLDGTLMDLHACETNSLKSAFVSAGILHEEGIAWPKLWETYAPIKSRYWNQIAQCGLTREEVIENSIRDTLIALGISVSPAPSIARNYWHLFCQATYLEPGARELLSALKDKVALGLVTNGYKDAQRGRIQASGLSNYFTTIVISEEVGCAKPEPRIFDLALSQLGVKHSQALYVGDSIEYDYKGALNAGIDFYYYDPTNSRPELDSEPVLRIVRLQDLEIAKGTDEGKIEFFFQIFL
jgi:YjjG family noncanonical pyrimidine nucleotidase